MAPQNKFINRTYILLGTLHVSGLHAWLPFDPSFCCTGTSARSLQRTPDTIKRYERGKGGNFEQRKEAIRARPDAWASRQRHHKERWQNKARTRAATELSPIPCHRILNSDPASANRARTSYWFVASDAMTRACSCHYRPPATALAAECRCQLVAS